jgi:glycine oxidase
MDDCVIVGGGVIGLSLAYELAQRGMQVHLIERGQVGREASWAGAGILPAGKHCKNDNAFDQLVGLSNELHPQWAAQLREETGIDTGLRHCGGIYLARDQATDRQLRQTEVIWRDRGVAVEHLTASRLADVEPALAPAIDDGRIVSALLSSDESQLRNPWHLQALLSACLARGVRVSTGVSVEDVERRENRVEAVRTSAGRIPAGQVCFATGAWSRGILERLGVQLALKPIRGQIVLMRCQRPLLRRIVNDGLRYLVPRLDGRVLVGSTQDDVGFDRRTTAEGVEGLIRLALDLAPELGRATIERTWAGLRPGTADGMPYLGSIPGLENAFVAAGHFRSGLTMSPATAIVMSELIRGEEPSIDLASLRVDR